MDKMMHIVIDKSNKTPLYKQVSEQIKTLVEKNVYHVEDKLPAIRTLSTYLGVNNVTVVNAYQQLSDEQITYKVRGSGSYIAPKSAELIAEISEFDNADNLVSQLRNKQYEMSEDTINFATATPKANLFPVTDFKKSLNYVLDRDLGEAFGYQEAKGYFPLRESICEYLKSVHVDTHPEAIQIISGAQQGLDIVAKSLLNYNDVVIVEAPTYSGALATFRSRGVKIIEVPMLIDGVNVKKLEALIKRYKPKLMFTMTHCQNPTGYSYSQKKKEALLTLANTYDFYILEDDYVGELIYTNKLSLPIKAIDVENRVIYLKSFSKILMPGLRLGFMIVPKLLMQSVLNAKEATDISTSGLIQKAFDVYLRKGHWTKQLITMKRIYYKRFKLMIELLNEQLPRSVSFYVPKGGILFWIELPKGKDGRSFYEFVGHGKIAFVPGDLFYYNSNKSSAIRLSIAAVSEEEIKRGVLYLCEYLEAYLNIKV